jgi:hypothetical protein
MFQIQLDKSGELSKVVKEEMSSRPGYRVSDVISSRMAKINHID